MKQGGVFIKKLRYIVLIIIVTVLAGTLLASCARDNQEQNNNDGKLKIQENLKFGIVEWPGVTVKTYVVEEVLENIGYEVQIETYTQPILLKGLSTGDIDAFLGAWYASLMSMLQPYLDEGTIVDLGPNLKNCEYSCAVPAYVYEAGVTSMADLNEYAEKFDYKYYGIEPGNDGNRLMQKAIKNNTYNLGEWELVASSTPAMLSQVQKAIKNKDWIVFSAWSPHWMNVEFDIKYLEDPEEIWGKKPQVGTLCKEDLPDADPNITRFLKQFEIKTDYQSKWILEYDKKNRPAEAVAQEWVANNVDVVSQWMEGVKTVDGKDAREAIKNAYQ